MSSKIISQYERTLLSQFNKYGFFDSEKLNECFLKLLVEFCYLNKSYPAGYLERNKVNWSSLHIANLDKNHLLMLCDETIFNCDTQTPNHISIAKKSLTELIKEFDTYSISKTKILRQCIYYFNHETKLNYEITFDPELKLIKSTGDLAAEKKPRIYTFEGQNSFQRMVQILNDSKF